MTDYSELVKALRIHTTIGVDCDECSYYDDCRIHGNGQENMIKDAAAAIEALLKENKELIEDHPEMVEADGHWEWRKPNGEVLMPKRGKWIGVNPMVDSVQCSICGGQLFSAELETPYCPYCGARMEVQE